MPDILSWDLDLFLRLLVASGLGAVIGLERDMHGRPAGLRTHLLVCMGAALFTILSVVVANTLGAGGQTWDPGRIAAQIVTGIGFLGAGAILKAGFSVRGLTTASSLWIAAAIGMASGAGRYDLAGAATLLALISLAVLRRVERHFRKDLYRMLTVIASGSTDISTIVDIVQKRGIKVLSVDFRRDYQADTMECFLCVRLFHQGLTDKLSQDIVSALENADISLKEIKWGYEESR